MKHTTHELLACPSCHGQLDLTCSDPDAELCLTGTLRCITCSKNYRIAEGIPHFVDPEQLSGLNRRFSRMYDWFSWGYRAFSRIAFAFIGMDEEIGRREITDRLEPHGGRVLEVSIGPGVNLPYLVHRPDVGEVFGLDLSLGQLMRCLSFLRKKGWSVDLFLGNAEQLPFRDDSFTGVFHVGGINFFNDKKAAIDEMIRVAKPGTRILIADETERGAHGYEKFIPGFKDSFEGKRTAIEPPVDLVPTAMLETRLFDVWKGWFYCLEFRKPSSLEVV
jgi:ubiquinone/menaquinone biosynthesis C-methylase UbiE